MGVEVGVDGLLKAIDKAKRLCEVGEVGVRPPKVSSTLFVPPHNPLFFPASLVQPQYIYLSYNPHLPHPLNYKPLQ